MKNLDFALSALAHVKSRVVFTIYGPISSPSYWQECQRVAESLPENIRAAYKGEIPPSKVRDALSQHDLFFLPTRGENYGHVIHEALASAVPVLISDQTPWRDIHEAGIGWTLPLHTPKEFSTVIDRVSKWTDEEHNAVRLRAIAYAERTMTDLERLESNLELFRSGLSL